MTSDSEYCGYHRSSYTEILEKFPRWEKAYGKISWERYLESLLKLGETGEWAKEVAAHELSKAASNSRP